VELFWSLEFLLFDFRMFLINGIYLDNYLRFYVTLVGFDWDLRFEWNAHGILRYGHGI